MNTRTIDKMLRIVEQAADIKGDTIEENPMYMFICTVLTDMDFGERPDDITKTLCRDYLLCLFNGYGLDYKYWLNRYVGT